MTVVTTRSDFETLIDLRMKEAKLLIDAIQDWDGAFYLAGYAVECALKIRIISQLIQSDSFPTKDVFDKFYKHDLVGLRKIAGLSDEMNADTTIGPHWDVVAKWSEQSRYQIGKTEREARQFYQAIEGEVLPWIKKRW